MKHCKRCGQDKPISAFSKDKGKKDGLCAYCSECNREKTRRWQYAHQDAMSKWRAENRERLIEKRQQLRQSADYVHTESLHWKYGITHEIYLEIFEAQEGKCAICGATSDKYLHVDHDHLTGVVRGLLCGNCNKALGLFQDDPERMWAAIKYLAGGIVWMCHSR